MLEASRVQLQGGGCGRNSAKAAKLKEPPLPFLDSGPVNTKKALIIGRSTLFSEFEFLH